VILQGMDSDLFAWKQSRWQPLHVSHEKHPVDIQWNLLKIDFLAGK
jgi:hypothetical protein